MSQLSFEEAVARLGAYQSRGWRLGLDRMQEFLRRLGLVHSLGPMVDKWASKEGFSGGPVYHGPQYIHVAGTNGKGSVCAYLQSMLHEQGYVVGATYSPFVYDVRERVQLGRDLISKNDFARLTEVLLTVGETLEETEFGGPTEFEMKTALGFLYWAEKKADWVALEVGLGGRLDATNVVTPACSVITSVGLDHTAILGDTLALIAREKAGIIKPGRPVVVGEMHDEAREVVEQVARDNGSAVWLYGRDVRWEDNTVYTPTREYGGLWPGIKGVMQGHNLALSIAAMEIAGAIKDDRKLERGALSAWLPGRFELIQYQGRTFVLDGAHNPQAATHLVETLRAEVYDRPLKLITGRIEGHEVKPFFDALEAVIGRAYVARIDFHRAMDPDEVIGKAGHALRSAVAFQSSCDALEACLRDTHEGDAILVTGSFYLVGEIGNLISPEAGHR